MRWPSPSTRRSMGCGLLGSGLVGTPMTWIYANLGIVSRWWVILPALWFVACVALIVSAIGKCSSTFEVQKRAILDEMDRIERDQPNRYPRKPRTRLHE